MKIAELRNKTENELETRQRELSEQLFKLRFQRSTGRLENPMKIREVKREIARIRTLLNESREPRAES
ncbi:MAG TPA: 50S ribosomal protein L29 [Thermoanaerobaculia bacterium]|nr:50S ribosomal protein L29 [Thermoanaerobaculia bacterium]